ncbi:hypothetical protein A2U01_0102058, partial [Trifolium medium]|nr:hypothetical protein [Trifolium medium]
MQNCAELPAKCTPVHPDPSCTCPRSPHSNPLC